MVRICKRYLRRGKKGLALKKKKGKGRKKEGKFVLNLFTEIELLEEEQVPMWASVFANMPYGTHGWDSFFPRIIKC